MAEETKTPRRRPVLTLAATLATVIGTGLLVFAQPALAQAVCTAPHSSPGLAAGGGIAPLARGRGWAQLSGYAQNADQRFDQHGARTDFFLGGRSSVRSAYFTVALGLVEGVEVWAQSALQRIRYEDESGFRERTGVGDVRLAARVSASRVRLDLPINLRGGVKLPGSNFPVDATVLPLSEGQPDAELSVETGHALEGGALFLVGGAGYRWRFGESASGRRPADEWFGRVAVGGRKSVLRWELALEGLRGGAPVQQGVELVTDSRRMLQLAPTLALSSGPGELDLTIQLPLAGRNLPSDAGLGLGYRLVW
jgi:hypothetical protein